MTMTESSTCPALNDHKIFLFHAFKRQSSEAWDTPPPVKNFGDMLQKQNSLKKKSNWIYPHAKAFFKNRYANDLIWQAGKLKLGSDLHPYIQNTLGANGRQEPDAKVFEISQQARNFIIEGKLVDNPEQLSLPQKQRKKIKINFSSSAVSRINKQLLNSAQSIAATTSLYLMPDNIQAICFRTGWIIFVLEAKIVLSDHVPLNPVWLQEAMAVLTKINKLSWHDPSQAEASKQDYFHLDELISGLSGIPRRQKDSIQRVYSATYLQFEQAPSQQQLTGLQIKLSRHYTDAYDIVARPENIETVKEFNNVAHTFSLEGCCSYCITENAPEKGFLNDYFNATYHLHYLPIIILSVHEYTHLLDLTNNSSFWPELNDGNLKDLNQLTELRDSILHFRLCFRYSAVSKITMHNQTNIALRKTLALDTMLTELDNDTKEINAFLEQSNAENLNNKLHWISMLAAGVITLTASYQTLQILLADIYQHYGIDWAIWKANTSLSLIFAVIAVLIIKSKKNRKK